MNPLFGRSLALASLAVLLAGCGSSPTVTTYVLGDPAAPATGIWSETGLPVVELKTVSVPDYLDSSDMLRRTGPNQVTPSPTGRWGERLSVGLTRALAAALAARLPGTVVTNEETPEPTRRILVDVDSFEIGADGRCLLAARWRIAADEPRTTIESQRGTFDVAAGSADDAAAAVAMTRAIDQLADAIAPAVRHALPTR